MSATCSSNSQPSATSGTGTAGSTSRLHHVCTPDTSKALRAHVKQRASPNMQPRDKQCDLKRAHISGGTAAHVTGVLFSRSVHQFPFGCSTPDQAWPFRHVPVPASAEPLEQRTRHLRLQGSRRWALSRAYVPWRPSFARTCSSRRLDGGMDCTWYVPLPVFDKVEHACPYLTMPGLLDGCHA